MAAAAQSTSDQIAALNSQIASDQQAIASASSSASTWKYIGIGAAVLAVVAIVINLFRKHKKKT